ncbi:30S ribosomal subunit maturation GTPase Era [uncultured Gammaproteobacteria bacterium]
MSESMAADEELLAEDAEEGGSEEGVAVDEADRRCGFIALVGAPNVGKSTLLNALVGTKLSIVSPKVQTTRARVLGIIIEGTSQLVFVDTPGIFAPRRRLDRAMVAAAWQGANDADLVVVLVDAARRHPMDADTRGILTRMTQSGQPAVLVLNKVDLIRRDRLFALAEKLNHELPFVATFMISALTGDGVADLRLDLSRRVELGPWLFPEDQLSDIPLRLLASEITREQVFIQLQQELPYASTVETEEWQEFDDGSVRIGQVIFVERDSQKAIVLGRGGSRIKQIGIDARKELEKVMDRRVHLGLFVKVRDNWGDDPDRYQAIGLEFQR